MHFLQDKNSHKSFVKKIHEHIENYFFVITVLYMNMDMKIVFPRST